jgi:hypothetical protein
LYDIIFKFFYLQQQLDIWTQKIPNVLAQLRQNISTNFAIKYKPAQWCLAQDAPAMGEANG